MGCCCVQNLKHVDDMDENMTDSRVRLSNNNEALVLKEQGKIFYDLQGNNYFKNKAYLNAIRCYTQALVRIN